MQMKDMLAPDPIKLPEDPGSSLEKPTANALVEHPDSPALWAQMAQTELQRCRHMGASQAADFITAYAFARTAYHRSLDRLRANGWKGWGPVPYDHIPNQGVLLAIATLAKCALAIGEDQEYDRLRQMLSDADPAAVATLLDA